jgi:hypothetical protein
MCRSYAHVLAYPEQDAAWRTADGRGAKRELLAELLTARHLDAAFHAGMASTRVGIATGIKRGPRNEGPIELSEFCGALA